MISDDITRLFGNFLLTLFDGFIKKLFNLAAADTNQVIMMGTEIQLEHGAAFFKIMADYQTGGLKLRQNAINGCKSDLMACFRENTVNFFCAEMATFSLFKNFKDTHSWYSDFQSSFFQIHVVQFHCLPCHKSAMILSDSV